MTGKQLTLIHSLARAAWQAHVYQVNSHEFHDPKAEDAWRRLELKSVTGKRSSKDLTEKQFEDACLHFAVIAGNERAMSQFASAEERRYHWQIHRWMRLLSLVRGQTTSWSYVRSIMDRMSLAEQLDDVPVPDLQAVLMALDTHYRRLCSKLGFDSPKMIRDLYEKGSPEQVENLETWIAKRHEELGMLTLEETVLHDFHGEHLCEAH